MGGKNSLNLDMPILSQRLLLSIAEELKLPLMQIGRLAENDQLNQKTKINSTKLIQSTADSALKLIDNYILGVRLSLDPDSFDIEAVSVSSVLYDAAQQLDSLAKSYGVDLELSIGGKYGPVAANKRGLEAALVSIGATLIEALPALNSSQLKLQLALHRSRYGVVAGIYTDTPQLSANALSQGRKLHASSRQPFVSLTHSSGAGIFIADAILKAMNLNLMASRHHRLYGIGTVLKPNHQLQLVS